MNLLMSDLKHLSLIKQVSGEGVRNSVKVWGQGFLSLVGENKKLSMRKIFLSCYGNVTWSDFHNSNLLQS